MRVSSKSVVNPSYFDNVLVIEKLESNNLIRELSSASKINEVKLWNDNTDIDILV